MKLTSEKKFLPVSVGSCVIVPVPEVDRSKIDPRNLIGVVSEQGLYKLGTKSGIISQLYARNQFQPCSEQFICISDVPDTMISLRSSAIAQSKGSGQGFLRCSCKQGCRTDRCRCRKRKILCSSKCHSKLSCCNK